MIISVAHDVVPKQQENVEKHTSICPLYLRTLARTGDYKTRSIFFAKTLSTRAFVFGAATGPQSMTVTGPLHASCVSARNKTTEGRTALLDLSRTSP